VAVALLTVFLSPLVWKAGMSRGNAGSGRQVRILPLFCVMIIIPKSGSRGAAEGKLYGVQESHPTVGRRISEIRGCKYRLRKVK
jgi:hypothetical protein